MYGTFAWSEDFYCDAGAEQPGPSPAPPTMSKSCAAPAAVISSMPSANCRGCAGRTEAARGVGAHKLQGRLTFASCALHACMQLYGQHAWRMHATHSWVFADRWVACVCQARVSPCLAVRLLLPLVALMRRRDGCSMQLAWAPLAARQRTCQQAMCSVCTTTCRMQDRARCATSHPTLV